MIAKLRKWRNKKLGLVKSTLVSFFEEAHAALLYLIDLCIPLISFVHF